jgi:NTE family protein
MGNLALVLTGGGARAAYQAGVMRAISEIWPHKHCPFKTITGLSAGSINACLIASHSDDFQGGTEKLWALWNTLRTDKVFRSDSLSLARLAGFVLRDLALGGMFPRPASSHLLDNSPLRKLILDNVDFDRLHRHIGEGTLNAFAVTATNYHTGCAITFFDGGEGRPEWVRNNHLGWRQPIGVDHIMASSAIPVFFPAQKVGGAFYGDGCVRLLSPASPALHMGAEALFAIGVRRAKDPATMDALNRQPSNTVSFAEIAGVFMNAVFLDTLESDLARLSRMNQILKEMDPASREALHSNFRIIPIESQQPTKDLASVASGHIERYPFILKHLLRGLGAGRKSGRDVLSYLAFDYSYCGKLLRLGYKDAMERRDSIHAFLKQHAV